MTIIIISNKAKCLTCDTTLESKEMHDIQTCQCPPETKTTIQGGNYYLARHGNNWEEQSETVDITHLDPILKDIETHNNRGQQVLQCEKGWWELVTQCHKELKRIDPKYSIIQIKQKMGQLRYYHTTELGPETHELMDEITRRYEKVASRTCELTGKNGQLYKTSTGWLTVRNPEHAPPTFMPIQQTYLH